MKRDDNKPFFGEGFTNTIHEEMKSRDVLKPDEELLAAIMGKIEQLLVGGVSEGKKGMSGRVKALRGAFGITNIRLVFYQIKRFGRYEFSYLNMDEVYEVRYTKGTFRGRIEVSSSTGSQTVKQVNNKDGIIMRNIIQEQIELRQNKRRDSGSESKDVQNPLDSLKMKFINGEITEDEFKKMKEVLE